MDERARKRLAAIAEGIEQLDRESLSRAARATPGEKIERALSLSSLMRRSQSNFEKPLPVSLVSLWAARRKTA